MLQSSNGECGFGGNVGAWEESMSYQLSALGVFARERPIANMNFAEADDIANQNICSLRASRTNAGVKMNSQSQSGQREVIPEFAVPNRDGVSR